MFGHLKAEEFINIIDGVRLSQDRHVHLESCRACAEKLQSIRSIHGFLANEDDAIPEPEWDQFRESVRVELLSRSVKRDSVVRRWTGWPIRPAVAWGFSFVLLICVGAGGYLWHLSDHQTEEPRTIATSPSLPPISETSDVEAEIAAWGRAGLFEDLASIQEGQVEQVRKLLLAEAQQNKMERQ